MASAARPTISDASAGAWPAPDARGIAQGPLLALAVVRTLSSQCADGGHAVHHPLGTGRVERQASAMRTLYGVRRQGRDAATSRLGRRAGRISALPYANRTERRLGGAVSRMNRSGGYR
jgi:hypothetical protein